MKSRTEVISGNVVMMMVYIALIVSAVLVINIAIDKTKQYVDINVATRIKNLRESELSKIKEDVQRLNGVVDDARTKLAQLDKPIKKPEDVNLPKTKKENKKRPPIVNISSDTPNANICNY